MYVMKLKADMWTQEQGNEKGNSSKSSQSRETEEKAKQLTLSSWPTSGLRYPREAHTSTDAVYSVPEKKSADTSVAIS